MNNVSHEALAQVIFWSGIGCLPVSIGAFVAAFCIPERWKALAMLGVGSVTTTHFLWYFAALGVTLATKVGEPHLTPWLLFYPIGFFIAASLAVVLTYIRTQKK